MTFLVIDGTRHWLSTSSLFLRKTLKSKDINALTMKSDQFLRVNRFYVVSVTVTHFMQVRENFNLIVIILVLILTINNMGGSWT